MGLVMRRTVGVAMIGVAILWDWFDFAIATPYFLAHHPGPDNPTFAWYIVYNLFPLISIVAAGSLVFGGLRFVRTWTSPAFPLAVATIAIMALSAGGLVWSLSTR